MNAHARTTMALPIDLYYAEQDGRVQVCHACGRAFVQPHSRLGLAFGALAVVAIPFLLSFITPGAIHP